MAFKREPRILATFEQKIIGFGFDLVNILLDFFDNSEEAVPVLPVYCSLGQLRHHIETCIYAHGALRYRWTDLVRQVLNSS